MPDSYGSVVWVTPFFGLAPKNTLSSANATPTMVPRAMKTNAGA